MNKSTSKQYGQSSDGQTSTDVFESEFTGQKSSRSTFASSTDTNVDVRSVNSLVAPPPSFVSGIRSIRQLPSMTLNVTPELHSPTPPTPSDISSEPENAVDCSQRFAYRSSSGEFYCFPIEKSVNANNETKYRVNYGDPRSNKFGSLETLIEFYKTYPFLNSFTGEIEDFPVWLPCVRPFIQWQKK
ncbi:hypothetical protein M3Y95_01108600 [Aphelenchoides besseyi]|nr:hypothetical protein M3Y95_01108600 [Aphelenchoides besseyi]